MFAHFVTRPYTKYHHIVLPVGIWDLGFFLKINAIRAVNKFESREK